ncbi:MAG: LytTR family DNA-binding domain-containing protein [Alteromonas sp.]|uniref:LytTR family DNA-binding domain-containing protein n=1 Tax=Alteromonas sp. TaxID=232 RepID=UPI0032D8F9DF
MINKMWFQKHQSSISLCLLALYFIINGFINSTTELMEAMRNPPLPFSSWEPFVWEYTSAIGSFVVVCALAAALNRYPWNWNRPLYSAYQYSVMGLLFAISHIMFMVISREAIYTLAGRDYQFAVSLEQWTFELIYEIRKDVWSFVFFVVLIECYRYTIAQWLGNASSIALDKERYSGNSKSTDTSSDDFLLIKKLGREFLINKQDINWMASSGNYVNLHIGANVYPMRTTLSAFLDANTHLPFRRVHRSFAVNINDIDNIEVAVSGDGIISLTSGQTVKMSRRFKLTATQ